MRYVRCGSGGSGLELRGASALIGVSAYFMQYSSHMISRVAVHEPQQSQIILHHPLCPYSSALRHMPPTLDDMFSCSRTLRKKSNLR